MTAPLTADDLLPSSRSSRPTSATALLRLGFRQSKADVEACNDQQVQPDVFGGDGDALSWEAEDWEGVE